MLLTIPSALCAFRDMCICILCASFSLPWSEPAPLLSL